jgi:DNA-binding transcriptional regulator YiaG
MEDVPLNGEMIRALRERLQLTQTAFADRIGCAQGAVAMWEAGQRHPRGLYAKAVRALMKESPPPKKDSKPD